MQSVDKHIPLPTPQRGIKPLYPWEKLAVGDSFEHPGTPNTAYWTRKLGHDYTTRRLETGGMRVWRTR